MGRTTSVSSPHEPSTMTKSPSHPPPQNMPITNTSSSTTTTTTFTFPPSHSFPPLYTLQPNPTTRLAQFEKWSRIITAYCAHHRLFTLSLPGCLSLPLFKNTTIKRRLDEHSVREILTWMSSQDGGKRVEWVTEAGAGAGGRARERERADKCFVFWKRPEEWADVVYSWVEETGQRGAVLTVWEMLEGERARGEEFWGMDPEVFQRALGLLVKRGKAQVFGEDEGKGVKFF